MQEIQTLSQDDQNGDLVCELAIRNNVLIQLQQEDAVCQHIMQQIEKGNIKEGQIYKIDNKQFKKIGN